MRYADLDLVDNHEKSISLLDLDAEYAFNPTTVAEQLVSTGLDVAVTRINLFISDLILEKPLLGLATDLCLEIIKLLPDSHIDIAVYFDLNSLTWVVPPQGADVDWLVFRGQPNEWSARDMIGPGRLAHWQERLTRTAFRGSLVDLFAKFTIVKDETVRATYDIDEDLRYSFNSI